MKSFLKLGFVKDNDLWDDKANKTNNNNKGLFVNTVKRIKGFTLIELMVTVAVVGILSATAIPIMSDYTNRAKSNGALQAIAGHKFSVAMCMNTSPVTSCDGGVNGVSSNIGLNSVQYIRTLSIADGVISMEMESTDLIGNFLSLSLTPSLNNGVVQWDLAGTGCNDSRGVKCI